jgi:hypothetical protein
MPHRLRILFESLLVLETIESFKAMKNALPQVPEKA